MRVTAWMAALVLVAGCTGPAAEPTMPAPSIDASPVVHDGPIAGDPIGRLQAYGQAHADEFGGMYIDPPGGQHAVMLFTANEAAHAAAVEAIKPGTSVRTVEHTEAELQAILAEFDFEALKAQGIEMLTASVDVINNRATLEAISSDLTAEARLELSYG